MNHDTYQKERKHGVLFSKTSYRKNMYKAWKVNLIIRKVILYALLILCLVIFAMTVLNIEGERDILLNPDRMAAVYIVPGVILLAGFLFMVFCWLEKLKPESETKMMWAMGSLIVLLQMLVLFFLIKDGFKGITDTSRIINEAIAMTESQNGLLDNEQAYFGGYGNTYPFTIMLYYICKGIRFLGINCYEPILMFLNVVLIDISGVFGIRLMEMLRGRIWSLKLLFLFLICPTTYVWVVYTYTNTFSMPFVMGVLYFGIKAMRRREGRIKNIILTGVFGGIGYQIRATTIIPLIAILLGIVLTLRIKSKKQKCIMILIIIGIFLGSVYTSSVICQKHLKNQTIDRTFPITHWMMLGLNAEWNGFTNNEDVKFSRSFPTKDEKIRENLKQMKKRFVKMGPVGYATLVSKKMMYVWGLGNDGCLRYYTSGENISSIHQYLYGDKSGIATIYRQVFRSSMFLFVLIGVFYQLRKKGVEEFFVISLSVFGAVLFFILWEANSKYNICFMGLFLILMSDGISHILQSAYKIPKRVSVAGRMWCKRAISILFIFIPLCLTVLLVIDSKYYIYDKSEYREVKIQNCSYNEEYTPLKNRGEFVEQTFTTGKNFNEIRVLQKSGKGIEKNSYRFELLDEWGKRIASKNFPQEETGKKDWQEFDVPAVHTDGSVRQYRIRIVCEKDQSNGMLLAITPYKSYDLYLGGELMINSNKSGRDMTFSVSQKGYESCMGIVGYVAMGVVIWLLFGMQLIIVLRQ